MTIDRHRDNSVGADRVGRGHSTCMCSMRASCMVSSCVPASRASHMRSSGSVFATKSGRLLWATTSSMPTL